MARRHEIPIVALAATLLALQVPSPVHAAEADPCQLADGSDLQGAFQKLKLTGDDRAALTGLGITIKDGDCQVEKYMGGGRVAYGCRDQDIRKGLRAVCDARAERRTQDQAAERQREEALKVKVNNLRYYFHNGHFSERLLDDYAEVRGQVPEDVQKTLDRELEGALIRYRARLDLRHMKRHGFEPPEGAAREADALETRGQSLWLDRQDQDCVGDADCLGRITAEMDRLTEENYKTLEMQHFAEVERRQREEREAEMLALQQAREQLERERIANCDDARRTFAEYSCVRKNLLGKRVISLDSVCQAAKRKFEANNCAE